MTQNTIPPSPRRALVVIDVQMEYFSGGLLIEYPPIAQSLPNIARAMDAAHAAGIPIVVVQHSESPVAPLFAKGSASWALHEAVASRPRDHYIESLAQRFHRHRLRRLAGTARHRHPHRGRLHDAQLRRLDDF